MTDTKIQRLRGIAAWLEVADWTNMAANVRDAANELERYAKLRDAAMEVLISSVSGSAALMAEKLIEMRNVMEFKE